MRNATASHVQIDFRAPRPDATPKEALFLLQGQPDRWPPARPAPAEGQPIIEWDYVSFARQRQPILRGATLSASSQNVLALLGANGAGKTTLLQHANGLLRPQRGTVRVAGQEVGRRPVADLARSIGLVAQAPRQMLFASTVQREIAAGPTALGRSDPAWTTQVVERLALAPLLQRIPQQLSAGEQRRVAVASVLTAWPQAVVLDEPTAGQDARGRTQMHALIRLARIRLARISLGSS